MKAIHCLLPLAFSVAVSAVFPYLSFAGSMPLDSGKRSGKSSPFARSEHRPSRASQPVPAPPKGRKFVVIRDRLEEPVSVSVDQTIVVLPAEAKKNSNRIYIPPRWVETESGVLVLEPGRWVEAAPGMEY